MIATKVSVTEKHIADGEPGDPYCCALALALLDALSAEGAEVTRIEVTDAEGGWTAEVEQDDAAGLRVFWAELDEETVEFVEAFDAQLRVGPFETELTWEAAS